MRILLTNWTMVGRHGSVLYVRDLALGLLRSGFKPVVYAPELGSVADELLRATVPVIDRLAMLGEMPDLIHANSGPDALLTLLRFPDVPMVFTSHAWNHPLTRPPLHPNLIHLIAVDETCRDDLTARQVISPDRVTVIQNAVDGNRFRPRPPLPDRPRKAMVFSNYAGPDGYAEPIRIACQQRGIDLRIIGEMAGTQSAEPEALLPEFDIVFAKGRAATEAIAVGCAVIVCDTHGLAGLVTADNWKLLRSQNFGRRSLRHRVSVESITDELARYSASDAAAVSQAVRRHADLDHAIDQLVALYRDAVVEFFRGSVPNLSSATLANGWESFLPTMAQLLRGEGHERVGRRYAEDTMRSLQSQFDELRATQPRENPIVKAIQSLFRAIRTPTRRVFSKIKMLRVH